MADPGAQMKGYLKDESRDAMELLKNASEAMVRGSKVELGIGLTTRRFAASEKHIQGTAALRMTERRRHRLQTSELLPLRVRLLDTL